MSDLSDKRFDTSPQSSGNEPSGDSSVPGDNVAKQRERVVMSTFASIMDASTRSGPEREARIEESIALILKTPGLSDAFVDLLLSEDDGDRDRLEEARTEMMYAADPFTGVIPDDYEFAPEIRRLIDTTPELQAYRNELMTDALADNEARWQFVADAMQPRIDALYARRRLIGEWPSIEASGEVQCEVATFRSASSDQSIESISIDDPHGAFRLGVTRFPAGSGRFEVVLGLYEPEGDEPLAVAQDDWRVYPMLDEVELPTKPFDTDAWTLADTISAEDLARIEYEVEFLPSSTTNDVAENE